MFIPCSAIYFLEVIAHLSLKLATDGPFICKKISKMSIFEAINLSKRRSSSINLCFWEDFRTFKPCTTTYFLEVSAHVSLKGATSGFFRCKKHKKCIFDAIDLKQKQGSSTKVVDVCMLTF